MTSHESDGGDDVMGRHGSFALAGSSMSIKRVLRIDENSWVYNVLDWIALLVLINDTILNPYLLAWELRGGSAIQFATWAVAIYWTINFLLTIRQVDGETDGDDLRRVGRDTDESRMASMRMRRRYLQSRAATFLLVMVDWTGIVGERLSLLGSDWSTFYSVANTCRVIKIVRLARLFRLVDRFLSRWSLSARLKAVTHVLKIILALLMYNHLVCCIWCFMGRKAPSDTGRRWLHTLDMWCEDAAADNWSIYGEIHCEKDLGTFTQYIVAFHWTLAQMTPGPITIIAQNTAERVFNALVLLCGILFGSLIVSLISGQIMSLIIARREENRKMEDLEKFLRQNNVGMRLAAKVKKQVRQRLHIENPITEGEVEALTLLSTSLRLAVVRETRMRHIMLHPLFKTWESISVSALHMLCDTAVSFIFLSAHDDLFLPGQEAPGAFYVILGHLTYFQEPMTSKLKMAWQEDVTSPAWLCEAALWSEWFHVGRMEAMSPCHLLTVSADGLVKTVQRKDSVAQVTRHYAKSYHSRLVAAVPPHAPTWPSDVVVPFTEEPTELLSQEVALDIYRHAKASGQLLLTKEEEEGLEEELKKEQCTIKLAEDGSLQRVVAVVALRLQRDDGRALVQLGKVDKKGGVKVACKLPGSKRAIGELFKTALQRIVDRDLHDFASAMKFDAVEHHTKDSPTPKFGMATTYIRTVHTAYLNEWSAPQFEVVPASKVTHPRLPVEAAPDVIVIKTGSASAPEVCLYGWMMEEDMDVVAEGQHADVMKEWLGKMHDLYVRGVPEDDENSNSDLPEEEVDHGGGSDDKPNQQMPPLEWRKRTDSESGMKPGSSMSSWEYELAL